MAALAVSRTQGPHAANGCFIGQRDYHMFLALQIVKLDLADLDGEWFCIGNPSSLKVIVNHIIRPDTDDANVLA